ncbi:unnamed protein product [Sphagnum balticum]
MLLFSPSKSTSYPVLVLLLFALVILEMNCFLCRISKLERFWKRQCALHFCVLQPRLWPPRLVITQDVHRVRCCITLLPNNCSRGLSEAQRRV